MDLNERTIEMDNIIEKCNEFEKINFNMSYKLLEQERKKSENYLKNALDIKE